MSTDKTSQLAFEASPIMHGANTAKQIGQMGVIYANPSVQKMWIGWQASRQQALKYAATQCRQLADCEENTDEYRNGAAWCAERIGSLK